MDGRDREADMDRLVDEFHEHSAWEGESYVGLDGKRPFGSSAPESDVLYMLGIEPEDEVLGFSDEQTEYAEDLLDDLLDHMKSRWEEYKAMKNRGV